MRMPTPVVSVRAGGRDAALIREVASRLKTDPGFRPALDALLGSRSHGTPRPARRSNRGPFRDEATALAAVVDRLVAAHRPVAIRLFGSRATGTAAPDSDFDLLLVMPDGSDLSPERAYAPLLGLGVGCDVVPCSASEFAADARVSGTVCRESAVRGRLLYRS